MSATAESTRWDELSPFRASFLRHFTEPEDRAAMERIGSLAYELVLEFKGHWPDDGRSEIASETLAAVEDLRYLAGHLGEVGRVREDDALTDGEHAMCRLASFQSRELDGIANTLQASIR